MTTSVAIRQPKTDSNANYFASDPLSALLSLKDSARLAKSSNSKRVRKNGISAVNIRIPPDTKPVHLPSAFARKFPSKHKRSQPFSRRDSRSVSASPHLSPCLMKETPKSSIPKSAKNYPKTFDFEAYAFGASKRKKTNIACVHCVQAKAGCDMLRPCRRCIRLNKPDCVDRIVNRKRSISNQLPGKFANSKQPRISTPSLNSQPNVCSPVGMQPSPGGIRPGMCTSSSESDLSPVSLPSPVVLSQNPQATSPEFRPITTQT
eukprot:51230_1